MVSLSYQFAESSSSPSSSDPTTLDPEKLVSTSQDPFSLASLEVKETSVAAVSNTTPIVKTPYPPLTNPALEEEVLVGSVSITSATARGTCVLSNSPIQKWSTAPSIARHLFPCAMSRWKEVVVTLVPTGAATNLAGAAIYVGKPTYDPVFNGANVVLDPYVVSTLPHLILPFSSRAKSEFHIPWVHNKQWLNLSLEPTRILSYHCISVLQSLSRSDGAACSFGYSIFVRVVGFEQFGLQPSFSAYPSVIDPVSGPLTLSWSTSAYGGKKEAKEKSERGLLSGIATDASKVAGTIAKYDPTGISGVISGFTSTAADVLSYFGLDKPTTTDFSSFTQLRLGDQSLQMTGLDPSVRINVHPDAVDPCDVTPMGGGNYGAVGARASCPSLLYRGSLLSTVPAGTWSCTPLVVNPGLLAKTALGAYFPNCVSFESRFFTHWRGSLKYKIVFTADVYTDFTFNLALITGNPAGVVDPTLFINTTFKPSGPTTLEFTIPYATLVEWSIVNTQNTYIAGDWTMLLSQLGSPLRSGVVSAVDYDVFVSLGDDFEFAEPSGNALRAFDGLNGAPNGGRNYYSTSSIVPIKSYLEYFKRVSIQYTLGAPFLFDPEPFPVSALRTFLSANSAYRGSVRPVFYLSDGMYGPAYVSNSFTGATSALVNRLTKNNYAEGVVYRYEDYAPEFAFEVHPLTRNLFTYRDEGDSAYSNVDLSYIVASIAVPPTSIGLILALGDDFVVGVPRFLPVLSP